MRIVSPIRHQKNRPRRPDNDPAAACMIVARSRKMASTTENMTMTEKKMKLAVAAIVAVSVLAGFQTMLAADAGAGQNDPPDTVLVD